MRSIVFNPLHLSSENVIFKYVSRMALLCSGLSPCGLHCMTAYWVILYSKNEIKIGVVYYLERNMSATPTAPSSSHVEPMLKEDESRYVMFPIRYDDVWQMYKKQVDCFWRVEEVDLSKDLTDWAKLNSDEKYFISMVLAFFAASDGVVMENLAQRFMQDVQVSEIRAFYGFQIMMENIHSEMYSVLIDTYVQNRENKAKLFDGINNYPCIGKKSAWAKKWIADNRSSFAARLVAFACVEGIFFSSSFAAIYWIKKRGLMPGLTLSNEFISRDEALHTEFAVLLYTKLERKLGKKRVQEIVKEAAEIEKEFVCESLPVRLIGMNATLMSQYIELVAAFSPIRIRQNLWIRQPFRLHGID